MYLVKNATGEDGGYSNLVLRFRGGQGKGPAREAQIELERIQTYRVKGQAGVTHDPVRSKTGHRWSVPGEGVDEKRALTRTYHQEPSGELDLIR